jgi:hypothetical protein
VRLPVQHIECFHLVLLRLLESRLDRSTWVVKGGVNLRAWFGSLRYSEDLDLDAIRGSAHALAERVDRLLAARSFRDLLASQGLTLDRTSKPKQTGTTQRWKFELHAATGLPLHTRVEFSRRGGVEDHALEPVRAEVVGPYGLIAPTVRHYTARAAARQKIQALASRAEPQARDVWDLEHLLRTTGADPGPFTAAERRTLGAALERAVALPYDVYRSQVVPYLALEHQEVFGTPETWERMRELVVDRLSPYVA